MAERRACQAEGTARAKALWQRTTCRPVELKYFTFNGSVEKDEPTNKYIKGASGNRKKY